MLARMQPDTGGRFSLSLEDRDEACARYALGVATAGQDWLARAVVAVEDGSVDIGAWSGTGTPPAWLLQYARAALRSAWHQHREVGWPRRITRWRDQPARGSSESRER
jgi:hypothetical protein